jgi:hypothetical protein
VKEKGKGRDKGKSAANANARNELKKLWYKGVEYSVGSWVHLINPDEAHMPIVGRIVKILRLESWRDRLGVALTSHFPSSDVVDDKGTGQVDIEAEWFWVAEQVS